MVSIRPGMGGVTVSRCSGWITALSRSVTRSGPRPTFRYSYVGRSAYARTMIQAVTPRAASRQTPSGR